MKTNEVYGALGDLMLAMRKFQRAVGDDADNLEIDRDNPNDNMIRTEVRSIADKVDDLVHTIKYLNRPLSGEEGRLTLNESGRYELPSGDYFTSGSPIEYLDEEENEWTISRMEHNGTDYYIVGMGTNSSPYGVRVRTRVRSY